MRTSSFAVVLAALSLAACGGNKAGGASTTSAGATATGTSGSAGASSGTTTSTTITSTASSTSGASSSSSSSSTSTTSTASSSSSGSTSASSSTTTSGSSSSTGATSASSSSSGGSTGSSGSGSTTSGSTTSSTSSTSTSGGSGTTGACTGALCGSCTTLYGYTGAIDIPVATISGTLTLGGQALPATGPYGVEGDLFLIAKDTGAWHTLAYFDYTGSNNSLYGPIWTDKLVPGDYELLYERQYESSSNSVYETDATDSFPHALRVLDPNVTIAAGANALNVDIPVGTVTGTLTLGGQPLPATGPYGVEGDLFLVSKDTGAWHTLAYFDYTGSNNTLYGPTWTDKLVPGEYALYYQRQYDRSSNSVYETDATDPFPHGLRVLNSSVTIVAGANNLNVDIPVGTITGSITLGGQAFPSTGPYGVEGDLYLRSKDTGAWHTLAYFDYTGSNNTLYGPVWTDKLVPGEYELLYERQYDHTSNSVYETDATDPFPHGLRVLNSSVTITSGANNLSIDIPVGSISGTITLGGQPFPATGPYGVEGDFFLRSKDTGAWHTLAYFDYTRSNNTLYGPVWTDKLVPGEYELLYERQYDSTSNSVYETDATDPFPHALRVLNSSVTIASGSNTLNLDIPVASISGTVTLAGQPFPDAGPYGVEGDLFLRSKDTGAWHTLAYFDYTGSNDTLYGPVWTDKLVPGEYELLYERQYDSTSNAVYLTDAADPFPHALRVLNPSVVLTSGANTLNLDIPSRDVGATLTLGGAAFPSTGPYGVEGDLFLRPQDSGAWHTFAYFDYTSSNNTLYGPVVTARVVPGIYDVLYERQYDTASNSVYETDATDPFPHGLRVLGQCIAF